MIFGCSDTASAVAAAALTSVDVVLLNRLQAALCG